MDNLLRYKCLVLDHDDTVVNSTAFVHYPAYLGSIEVLRPGTYMTLDEYFDMNCEPGIFAYYNDVVKLSKEELEYEVRYWLDYVKGHVPEAYPGIPEIIAKQRELGGRVCVVSHSVKENILRDYAANGLPEPDLILGLEEPEEHRKPNPWPLQEIMRRFGYSASELLVVDDLKPGYEMAKSCGVDFAPACWAHNAPVPRRFMTEHCERLFLSTEELYRFLFG